MSEAQSKETDWGVSKGPKKEKSEVTHLVILPSIMSPLSVLQSYLVEGLVVQREDAVDIIVVTRMDASASLAGRIGDKVRD